MIRQIEEGDAKGEIIIQKDKFKEFVEFKRWWVDKKIKEIGGSSKGCIYEPCSDIPPKWKDRYTMLSAFGRLNMENIDYWQNLLKWIGDKSD